MDALSQSTEGQSELQVSAGPEAGIDRDDGEGGRSI